MNDNTTKELFTHEIEVQLQEQFIKIWADDERADYMELNAICKIYHPEIHYFVYPITQDPEDENYLWCLVDAYALEFGSVPKSDLIEASGFVRDLDFTPIK